MNDEPMSEERIALFDEAWHNMQTRKAYNAVAAGYTRVPRSVIQAVHKRFGVHGVAKLYKKLESFGVIRGHDQRLKIKETRDDAT